MNKNPSRHRTLSRFRSWGWVILWMGVILATASWAYRVIEWGRGRFDERWYGIIIGVILLLALGWLAISLFRQRPIQRKRKIGIGLGYAILLGVLVYKFQNIPKPIEKIHLLEYGLLTPLVFKAVLIDVKDRLIFGITAVICLIGGIGDELFQGYLPNRVGDLEDLELNLWATALGLGFVWLFYQTRLPLGKIRTSSIQWLVCSISLGLIAFALFMTINPDKPFGYRYQDPNTTWYSRLSLEELNRQDREIAASRAPEIDAQYDEQIRHLNRFLEGMTERKTINRDTSTLLMQIFKHFCFRNQWMIQGRVEEAWNETLLGDAVYRGYTTLTVPPRWDQEVNDRVRRLIPDYHTPDSFRSGYIPDGTPVYEIQSRDGKWIAHSLIPSATIERILKKVEGHYMTALGETWDSAYSQFLKDYSSSKEPFLREMRIHLYRRDQHAVFGNYEIALGENRILEEYFGQTLHKTRFAWQNGTEERILALSPHEAKSVYISPVANHVTYWIRGSQVWICSIGLILLLLLSERIALHRMQESGN